MRPKFAAASGAPAGGRGALWDSDLVAGVAFHPRKARKNSGSAGTVRWIDGEVKTEDGVLLAYRLYCPLTPPEPGVTPEGLEAKAVVLVYFHANAELCTDVQADIGMYFDCGYAAVLCPEFRGYAWSTGKPRLTALGPDAEVMMQAMPDLLRGAGFEAPASMSVVVQGRSLGSACAIHVASKLGAQKISGLVIESGVVALLDLPMVRQMASLMPPIAQALAAEPDPLEAVAKLRQVKTPTVVIHGDRDEVSPVEQALQAHEACGAAVKKLVRYRNAHHNDVKIAAKREYFSELCLLREVASGEREAEALLQSTSGDASGIFAVFAGAFRCFPGVRRCLDGTD
eukprot:TRINITY_DN7416_c0_g1_i1.p1 TRINITY_DN7416_c0_g1~~TRINITY_DN7416_c0_g1_i1.p1  ORF type:complete len:342 (+),score=85.76 TRINITY_DN7416_c0_g1_i1:126-1151(+)